MTTPLNL